MRFVLSNPHVGHDHLGHQQGHRRWDDARGGRWDAGPLTQDQLVYLNDFVRRMAEEKAAFCTGLPVLHAVSAVH